MNIIASYSGGKSFKEIEDFFKESTINHLSGLANIWHQDKQNHLHANFTILTWEQRERILGAITDPNEVIRVRNIMREEIGELNIQTI